MTSAHDIAFQQDVIDRLARIETHVETIQPLQDRVRTLEGHRNWLAGAIASLSAVGGLLHFLKV